MSDAQNNVVELPVVEGSTGGQNAPVAAPVERLSEVDRMALELAKANRKVALAQAEKALAQNETAELGYKYVVLQLYMKYGLTELDAINENGLVVRGGAVQQGQ
jgi:hypothetical protein